MGWAHPLVFPGDFADGAAGKVDDVGDDAPRGDISGVDRVVAETVRGTVRCGEDMLQSQGSNIYGESFAEVVSEEVLIVPVIDKHILD